MTFTSAQQRAIGATGNTVVMAGAGAGKTNTLVERCARAILDQGVSVSEILMVTFTEASAAEARERLRKRLEHAFLEQPYNDELRKELALMDSAFIGTLHSFCFRLVRDHFYELGLDPAVRVMDERQERILFEQVLTDLLNEHYSAAHGNSEEVQRYILDYDQGRDYPLRQMVGTIHNFTQTRPNPQAWFNTELKKLRSATNTDWDQLLITELRSWCDSWLPVLEALPAENKNAHECARIIRFGLEKEILAIPNAILERQERNCWPPGMKGAHEKPFCKIFKEAKVLGGFTGSNPETGKTWLAEDWPSFAWPLRVVLDLVQQFEEHFAEAKRERSVVDFHDLEQFALNLLWDFYNNSPSELAKSWQQKFKLVFVDEYQDINRAQDLILTAISRPAPGNRFLVGDIKQSIYRFRQADPSIFRDYLKMEGWKKIALTENFRSHESILHFVNGLFTWLMRPETGQMPYDHEAALKFGAHDLRSTMQSGAQDPLRVELHLRIDEDLETEEIEQDNDNSPGRNEADSCQSPRDIMADLETAEKEARIVAQRLAELKKSHQFFDEREKVFRTAQYKDMVVLLRAVNSKVDAYSRAFARFNIPLQTKRNSFFVTPEIFDLVNLLTILDNPLQDVPLIGVLHSPLVGLSFDELTLIRQVKWEGPFWHAINQFLQFKNEGSEILARLGLFMERYKKWRKTSVHFSLSQRLESILTDTSYDAWVLAQPRGQQRHANIYQLVKIARDFDHLRGEGLHQFLRHVKELQEAVGDVEPAPLDAEDAVRLMSIHQSKGLEFPIVILADIGKLINEQVAKAATKLDESLGLCTKIKPPGTGRRFTSLPLFVARRRAKMENLAEEMRVLYVALTRARNLLILTGTSTRKALENLQKASDQPASQQIVQARSWFNWIAAYLSIEKPDWFQEDSGSGQWWNWRVHKTIPSSNSASPDSPPVPIADMMKLWKDLEINYPYQSATLQPAKASVSSMRRQLVPRIEMESASLDFSPSQQHGIDHGLAHHHFLELMDLTGDLSTNGLAEQTKMLVHSGALTQKEADLLIFQCLTDFWSGAVGTLFLHELPRLARELPFTIRFSKEDALKLAPTWTQALKGGEFIVLQGIIDLALIRPDEIWLLDFKTDSVSAEGVPVMVEKYRLQIDLYALALGKIYRRPVTKKFLHFFAPGITATL